MKFKLLVSAGLLLLLFAIGLPSASSTGQAPVMADLWFTSGNFASGSGVGVAKTADGLTIAENESTAVYTSATIKAPVPFNAVVPQWVAHVPETSSLEIRLRTARTEGEWSQWYDIHPQPDWMLPEDPDTVGQMIAVPATDITHQYLQFSISLGRYQGVAAPTLTQLRLTFIDSTAGPTAEELLAEQMALNEANGESAGRTTDGYPKPTVISREVWCTHADCDYSNGLEYHPVSHLILHHTVSSNDNSDWAAIVRAIWSFHTYNRGWGDIGYNYLVDMNGVLYEGHNGGDNVVGTHAADANEGSMALALIGTFTEPTHSLPGIRPPAPMLNSAAELFAWKADQRDIDVYDAGDDLPNVGWGLPYLMGHRDVYGTTECPGEQAHDLLPWLRDQVAARIGLTSPYIYYDELSDALTLSDANWYVPPYSCGHNGHAFYTWSTTDPAESVNWGEWRPQIPQDGVYEIQVYAPYCRTGASETDGAHYTIHHANGVSDVVVSHEDNVGLWMPLGQYQLREGFDTRIRLTDLTTTDDGRGVWFDAIRLRPFAELPTVTVNTVQPAADAWATNTVVDFRWDVNYPSLVTGITLEVATDSAFTDIVLLKNLGGSESSFTYDVGQDYADLYWRVKAKTVQDGTIVSAISHFGIDSTAPTSAVGSVYKLHYGDYVLGWQGNDASGIDSYNIDYRAQDQSAWTRLVTDTTITSAIFVPPDPNQTYWFRSQAKDVLGNEEAFHAQGDTSTEQAILLSHAIMLPVISR